MQSKNSKISLDELYFMVASIYSEQNEQRPVSSTFLHFAEVCGMLSIHGKNKKKEDIDTTSALCKVLGWYFPLMAKLKVRSIEEIIFRKYPFTCPYCRRQPHNDSKCKTVKGTEDTVDHNAVQKKYNENLNRKPIGLNEWQKMFEDIYPRNTNDKASGRSVIGLFEELGELAESIRVFERHPKYFAGEAADVFSYIMGIANEHSLELKINQGVDFDFEAEMLLRYPGICPQCGYKICICPNIPESTVGRMSKEQEISSEEQLFNLDMHDLATEGEKTGARVLQDSGGYGILKNLPIDRGETNRAMVLLCLDIAEKIKEEHPMNADNLIKFAIEIGSEISKPGSKSKFENTSKLIDLLKGAWPLIELYDLPENNEIASGVLKNIQKESCEFGIITALPKEFAAMRSMFEDSWDFPIKNDPNDYVIGTIPASDGFGNHIVALALLKDKGPNNAAIASTNLLRSFENVKEVIMVGIAGGVPNIFSPQEHVRLGDIVISRNGLIQYDDLKISDNNIELRSHSQRPSARLQGKVNVLEASRIQKKYPWEDFITLGKNLEDSKRPIDSLDVLYSWKKGTKTLIDHPHDPTRRLGQPKLHYGYIGSSNILLKNPDIRDYLGKIGVKAIEMEASGIADGTWNSGDGYLVIRGVCDYCDPNKNDLWQGYAAIVAAAYTRVLISSFSKQND